MKSIKGMLIQVADDIDGILLVKLEARQYSQKKKGPRSMKTSGQLLIFCHCELKFLFSLKVCDENMKLLRNHFAKT
jgi:hypothetical protein